MFQIRTDFNMKKTIAVSSLIVSFAISNPAWAEDADSEAMKQLNQVTTTATEHRYAIEFDGEEFSGPGYELLLDKGHQAHFFLIGEEHGIAENPKLAAQLFEALSDNGYSKLVIEISPPMANIVDEAILDDGAEGLRNLFSLQGGEPAFFGMAEEAEMLLSVRAAVPSDQHAFWGVDYEVAGDRSLLRMLEESDKPGSAQDALNVLVSASDASWQKYKETGSPQYIFTFSGDPALVRAVKEAWPDRDEQSDLILDSLEETLEINQMWVQGNGFGSNQRRAALLRANFIRHWQTANRNGSRPRVMAKLGGTHMIRGLNSNRAFDLGSLIPEIAASEGVKSFSVMVVPGKGSKTAVLNASEWSYQPQEPKDSYHKGIEPLSNAALKDNFTLIDLSPVRASVSRAARHADPALLNTAFGYDMLLVMSGSTPSGEFQHE